MDRIALAKRLEGFSKVFAANTPYHRELRAMAEVLSKADDEKFQSILSTDFTPEERDAFLSPTHTPYQRGQNLGPQLGGPKHNSIYEGLSSDIKKKLMQIAPAAITILQEAQAPAGVAAPVQASEEEKEAFLSPTHNPYQRGQNLGPQLGGPKHTSIYDGLSDQIKKELQRVAPAAITILQEAQAPAGLETSRQFDPSAAKGVAPIPGLTREEETAMSAEASTGMFWNKAASDAILNNLLRDVVGMDKKQIEDTGRKLEKGQISDGTHDGEKASTLKPEQTPDQKDVLKSDMVEKSHGKVQKEAASDNKEEDKASCGDKKEDKAAASEKEKELEDKEASLEDVKKRREQDKQKKMEKTVEELAKAKKPADSKEANELFEGIELGSPMEDVTIDAAEADKLSKLFV
jgi:hypothetical protein